MIVKRTVLVQGALAYGMRRAAAARIGENGIQIMTLPQMAARLAGGFAHLATGDVLDPAIRAALDEGEFQDIEAVPSLPGMTRAVAGTLRKVWHADLGLRAHSSADSKRVADLVSIAEPVRRQLPRGARLPGELRDAALARVRQAPILLGPVRLEGVHVVEPVWRTLLNDLSRHVEVTWQAPPFADTDWFHGKIVATAPTAPERAVVSCADPRHEALEALRWARELLSSGKAQASEIGIRLAIGALERQVLTQFLVEAAVPSLFGGLAGIAFGLALAWVAANGLGVPFLINVNIIAIALGFSALIGLVFGFFPARRAARLDPIEVLRHE